MGATAGTLTKRLEQLKKHNLWGDTDDDEYRTERDLVRAKRADSHPSAVVNNVHGDHS